MKRTRRILLLLGLALLVSYHRFPAPAVLEAEALPLEEVLPAYPAGTRELELVSAAGSRLRGLFVPSDPGAPVVLHLLDASVSCASPRFDLGELTRELADLGLSSLVVDYSGVGLSAGARGTRHLGPDARAAWDEAVRRAGAPERVLVRALSLGTLAASELLASGARPAALTLVVPVLPDSVVPRFGQALFGSAGRLLGSFLFRPVIPVEPFAVLAQAGRPVSVVLSGEDALLTEAEARRFEELARASGGLSLLRHGGHVKVALEARALFPEELPFLLSLGRVDVERREQELLATLSPELAARFPPGSEARQRLRGLLRYVRPDADERIAAAALSADEPLASARWLWCVRRHSYAPQPFESWVEVLSLRDPAGPLPIEALELASRPRELAELLGAPPVVTAPEQVRRMALGHGQGWTMTQSFEPAWYVFGHGLEVSLLASAQAVWERAFDPGLEAGDAERRFARLLLRAERIPECLLEAGPRLGLEAWDGSAWRRLELVRTPRPRATAGGAPAAPAPAR